MADAEGGKDESGGGAEGRIIVWEHVAENVYLCFDQS